MCTHEENHDSISVSQKTSPLFAIVFSLAIAAFDTAIIALLAGGTLPIIAYIFIGAGAFAIAFLALACCIAAGRADDRAGYNK